MIVVRYYRRVNSASPCTVAVWDANGCAEAVLQVSRPPKRKPGDLSVYNYIVCNSKIVR